MHKEQNTSWERCLFGACTVLKEQNLGWGRCFHDKDCSKEELQTLSSIPLIGTES